MLNAARARAKKRGIPFDIELGDLNYPDVCPILGIPLIRRSGSFHQNSPTIDRIDPAKGYTKGNVHVVSFRANRIKWNATLDELRKIVAFLERRVWA